MSRPAFRAATYEDVLAAPPNMVAEVIGGTLRLQPRPATPHAAASSALGEELGPPFKRQKGGPGGWILLDEPEIHIVGEIVVPDIAGWRREKMPVVPNSAYITLAPDWLCEVLSRRTEKMDRAEKLPLYAQWGVSHVWLVDPLKRTLEILRLENGKWLIVGIHKDNDVIRGEPFDAIELDLSILWADVEPSSE